VETGEHNHKAYFYDEEEKYPATILDTWLKEHSEIVEREERLMILGERTGFSTNNAPVNFKLQRSDGENILFYAFETADFTNLCMTFVDNIKARKEAQLLINCADPDLYNILDLESWYDPGLLEIAQPLSDPTDWIDFLSEMIESRKEMDPSEYVPTYFLALRWDKQIGVYRNENYKLSDRWRDILLTGPAVDVHVILGVQSHREINNATKAIINHMICAKGTEDASYSFLNSTRAYKLPDTLGFAVYAYGSDSSKFKIYQHTFTRKAEEREIKL